MSLIVWFLIVWGDLSDARGMRAGKGSVIYVSVQCASADHEDQLAALLADLSPGPRHFESKYTV